MKNLALFAVAVMAWTGVSQNFSTLDGWIATAGAETVAPQPDNPSSRSEFPATVATNQGSFQPTIQSQGDLLLVTVEGMGSSRTDALNQAWLEAVRLAVGMMIEAHTEIDQNQVAERIIAHSRGVVDRYEILMADESQASAGVYRIRMQATVRPDILRDGLQYVASGGQVIAFSPSDLKSEQTLAPGMIEGQDATRRPEPKMPQHSLLRPSRSLPPVIS